MNSNDFCLVIGQMKGCFLVKKHFIKYKKKRLKTFIISNESNQRNLAGDKEKLK